MVAWTMNSRRLKSAPWTQSTFNIFAWLVLLNTDLIQAAEQILERPEGLTDVTIDCPLSTSQATPIWLIDETAYYFTTLPQHYLGLPNGDLRIIMVDRSLNGTTFQCIVPFSGGERFGEVTRLIVTGEGVIPILIFDPPREVPQSAIDHQKCFFQENSKLLSWNTYNADMCSFSDMSARGCDTKDLTTYLNSTAVKNYTLTLNQLVNDEGDLQYFNITVHGNTDQVCTLNYTLRRFQIETNATTKQFQIPLLSKTCGSCVDLPPRLDSRGALFIAFPISPTEPDVLCPLNLFSDSCVNLYNCSHYNFTQYANMTSLTICANNTDDLQMCFHNFPQELNGKRLFLFYSNPQCINSETGLPEVTYIYTASFELVAESEEGDFDVTVNISDSGQYYNVCMQANTNNCHLANDTLFNVTLSLEGCELYRKHNIADSSCIDLVDLQLINCLPLTVDIEASNPGVHYNSKSREISGMNSENNTVCKCIEERVDVDLKVQESTKSSITFQLNCSSTICDTFELHLTLSNTGDDEMAPCMQLHHCSEQSVVFDRLNCHSNYTIVATPATKYFDQDCFLEMRTASTASCGGPTPPIAEIVIGTVCAIIIIVLVVIIIVLLIILVKRHRCNNDQNADVNENDENIPAPPNVAEEEKL